MADGLSAKAAVGSRTNGLSWPIEFSPPCFSSSVKVFCLLCLSFLSEQWQMAGAVMAVNTKLFKLQHLTWGLLNCRLCCHYNQWSYPWVNDLSVNVADKAVLLCLWPRPLKWHLVAKVLFGRLSIGYLAWCVWSCSFLPYWISKRKLVAARKFLLRPLAVHFRGTLCVCIAHTAALLCALWLQMAFTTESKCRTWKRSK